MDKYRFEAAIPFYKLEQAYRQRFTGNESDLRYQPQQPMRMEIVIEMPMMVRVLGIEKQFQEVLNRNHMRTVHELGQIVSEALNKPEASCSTRS